MMCNSCGYVPDARVPHNYGEVCPRCIIGKLVPPDWMKPGKIIRLGSFDKAEKLASDHWKYLKAVLETHEVSARDLDIAERHYRTAMVHGYKHGLEDANE